MKQRLSARPIRVITNLAELPVIVSPATGEALRLDSRDFHFPLERDLISRGILERIDSRRGGRRYMQRLYVNYFRHKSVNVTNRRDLRYAGLLEIGTSLIGFSLAYDEINRRVLDGITEQVPQLRDACDAQRGEPYLILPEDIFRPFYRADAQDGLPLEETGIETIAARKQQALESLIRRLPIMTEGALLRFAITYNNEEVQRVQRTTMILGRDSSREALESAQLKYLLDISLGRDLRNERVTNQDDGVNPRTECLMLGAIASRYVHLAQACRVRIALLDAM